MQTTMAIRRMAGAAVIACLVAPAGSRGSVQEEKPVREVYQAQAMGLT